MAESSTKSGAALALVGVVLGAFLGGAAQAYVEWQKHRYDEMLVRTARAEEILTLVSQSMALYPQLKLQMLKEPLETKVPTEPERVVALVTLYFPGVLPEAQAFELACIRHLGALQDLMIERRDNRPAKVDDNVTFKVVYDSRKALLAALSAAARSGDEEKPERRVKTWSDFAVALFALLAAIAWFFAATHPVTLPVAPQWEESPASRQRVAQAPLVLRGVRWNTAAAVLTGLSALSMFLSSILSR